MENSRVLRMLNPLGRYTEQGLKAWTDEAIECYESKFDCLHCANYYLMTSQPCQMKAVVIELFKRHGEPKRSLCMENPDLTKKEIEILKYVAKGLDNTEIIKKLSIGYSTLSSHLSRIFLKLGLNGKNQRVKAVLWYLKNFGGKDEN